MKIEVKKGKKALMVIKEVNNKTENGRVRENEEVDGKK